MAMEQRTPEEKMSSSAEIYKKSDKLHLGCGKRFIPGFIHVDALSFPHVDYQGPVDKLDWIPDGSLSLIYASHLLEHFGRWEVDAVLSEWFRVLKPGGVLRLAVPDFGASASIYVSGKLQRGLLDVTGLICGGQRDQYDYHKMIFDEEDLANRLLKVGFAHVRHWDWKTTEHAGVDDYSQAYLPHLDKDNGTLVSLNLEGVKE
jgi:predicted SAM-dependent methyltransferase